ncbi:MAG: DUF4203 domain-containing protein [Deltaproteobacteria bacterium]|nr:DUF4203 domain-containing protein [Deltaproteobacteria bacterium]
MVIIHVVVGIAALIFGRRLFWLFVGAIGFVVGMNVASQLVSGMPEWLILVIALIGGLLGALLAIFFQRVAIVAAGFAAGGYLILQLLNISGWQATRLPWLPFLIGALAGAILLYFLFDWTLIFLSSVTGASLITQAFPLSPPLAGLLLLALFIFGFVTQAKMMKRKKT